MIIAFDLLDKAILEDDVLKGDYLGHPFRGNQWTDASGVSRGGAGSTPDQDKQAYELRQQGKTWDEIAKILGYANGGAVRRLAMRHEERLKGGGGDKDKPEPEVKPKPNGMGSVKPASYEEAVTLAKSILGDLFNGDMEKVLQQLYLDSNAASLEINQSRDISAAEAEMEAGIRAAGQAVADALVFAEAEMFGESTVDALQQQAQHEVAQNAFNRFAGKVQKLAEDNVKDINKTLTGTKQGDLYSDTYSASGLVASAEEAIKIAAEDGLKFESARTSNVRFELVGKVDPQVITQIRDLGFVPIGRGWISEVSGKPRALETEATIVAIQANRDVARQLNLLLNDVRFGRRSAKEVLDIVSDPRKLVAQFDSERTFNDGRPPEIHNSYTQDMQPISVDQPYSRLGFETRQKILLSTFERAMSTGFRDKVTAIGTQTVGDLGVDIGSLDAKMTFSEVSARMQEIAKARKEREKADSFSVDTGSKRITLVRKVLQDIGVQMGYRSDLQVGMATNATREMDIRRAFELVSTMLPIAYQNGSGPMRNTFSGGGKMQVTMNVKGGRAHAQNNGQGRFTIKQENPPKKDGDDYRPWFSTLLHETGHGVEYANPLVRYIEALHWKSRAGSEKLRGLASISGNKGYASYEKGVKDEWRNYYAGKSYGGTRTSTYEIFTTGLQNIYMGDQSADPEHRNLVLGILAAASQMRAKP